MASFVGQKTEDGKRLGSDSDSIPNLTLPSSLDKLDDDVIQNTNCNANDDAKDNENSKENKTENTDDNSVLSSVLLAGDFESDANIPSSIQKQKPFYIKPAEDPYQKAWRYLLRHNILHRFQVCKRSSLAHRYFAKCLLT